jgi:uncharacterized protein (TIGR03000 family)
MLRTSIFGLVALVAVSVAAEQAQAGWRHHYRGYYGSCGSSGGSWGSWGSCGSSGGYYWGSYGSCGSSGGYYYGSCGSSGGSWGSCGSSGGSSGGYAPSYQAPVQEQAPTPPAPGPSSEPAAPAANPPAAYHPTYGPMRDSALLSVKVPADAKVFVNDRATTSTGSDREFVSRDLANGARYNYEVRAEFVRDGKPVVETKSVQLTAGQTAALDFDSATPSVQTADSSPRTTLIVHVPDDAKLFLAGRETTSTGPVREFSTTRLPSGSEWNTYAIRAVVERDGKQEVREQNVSLKAGESREVTISFDGLASEKTPRTASR